ncbi:MAG: hypothetical protein R3A46_19660 [Thermomicrobiales bacterium]
MPRRSGGILPETGPVFETAKHLLDLIECPVVRVDLHSEITFSAG